MRIVLNYFRNINFRQKLLVSYIVVVIIPITLLGLFSYEKSKDYLEQQIKASTEETLRQIKLNIENKLVKDNEFIRFMAFNPSLREILNNNDVDLLSQTKLSNEYVEPVIWYYMSINRDFRKFTIYSEIKDNQFGSFVVPSKEVKKEQWYIETKDSEVTNWFFIKNKVFATRRIYDVEKQQFLGVLSLEFNVEMLMKDIVKNSKYDNGLILSDDKGNTIYSLNTIYTDYSKELEKVILSSTDNSVILNNESYFLLKDRLPLQKWNISYYIPVNKLTVNTNEILEATITIIFVCVIVLIFIIWLFSKTLVSRIYKLKKKIHTVEKGIFDIDIYDNSKDEIGELTNSFGRMLKNLNNLVKEVYKSSLVQKEAELRALQSQINPHFLYNSLSVINWKAIESNNTEISTVAEALSKFYRTSLNKGKNLTTIKGELDNIRAYIDIQLIMHDYEFDVEYVTDERLYDLNILNFILQPVVENAILHGMDENVGIRGRLKIEARMSDNDILFIIEDNGIGMDSETIEKLLSISSDGYGLKNVNERIQLFYGNDYGLEINSIPKYGTVVTLRVKRI